MKRTIQRTRQQSHNAPKNGLEVVPAIYALLTDQTQQTYSRLLSALKEKEPALNPATVLTDFEIAAQNAFNSIFPNCMVRGCFFHFCQAVYRKIKFLRCMLYMKIRVIWIILWKT
ncbi:uncharacterized protein B4U80_05757, partial [Leptotrombidium deliense]